ncbi:cell division cycle protein [Anaeramoeba ignava]|uniref:Cell division cycle protein n=1 Tax=Anaeramoeba ignava TaxID=1746090 RepID=A0A9Q0LWG0_ANAIG|nr:cell division cycle protein [Anaeramoeba ignava]
MEKSLFSNDFLISEEELEQKKISKSEQFLFSKLEYERKFGLDQYYQEITNFTYKTVFMPISVEIAEAFMIKHESKVNEILDFDGLKEKAIKKLLENPEFEQKLQEFEKEIDDLIKKQFAEKGCFVKLNFRSPKDVPLKFPKKEWLEMFENALNGVELKDHVGELVVFSQTLVEALHVRSGSETMELLIHSKRIYEDFKKNMNFGKENFNSVCLAFREFDHIAPRFPQYEFRGFVYNKNLNAITQYNDFYYSEKLVNQKEHFEKIITEFYEKEIKNQVHLSHFIIDFFLEPKENIEDFTIKVIELNPFFEATGSVLFDWGKDFEILTKGPFEMRIVKEPKYKGYDLIVAYIPQVWFKVLWEKKGYENIYSKEEEKEKEEKEEKEKEKKKNCLIF